jgi:hypothetical protein
MHLLTHSLRRFNEKHLWHAYFENNTYYKPMKNAAHIFPSDYTTFLIMHLLTHSLRRFNEKHLWHAYFENNTYYKPMKNAAE